MDFACDFRTVSLVSGHHPVVPFRFLLLPYCRQFPFANNALQWPGLQVGRAGADLRGTSCHV